MREAPQLKDFDFDLKSYLEGLFAFRRKQNPSYSLRAFARQIGVDSSRLSKIFRGERPISKHLALEICERLRIENKALQKIVEENGLTKRSYQEISMDEFRSIADPLHYKVLEIMKLKDFKADLPWVSQRLGKTKREIEAVISRLQRLRLLRIEKDGSWVDETKGFSSHVPKPEITSLPLRRHQREILEEAIEALEDFPVEKRDQSSMMMATSLERMAEAKQKIKKFRRELCEFLESAKDKDSVFQLSISLFPVVEESKEEKHSKRRKT